MFTNLEIPVLVRKQSNFVYHMSVNLPSHKQSETKATQRSFTISNKSQNIQSKKCNSNNPKGEKMCTT